LKAKARHRWPKSEVTLAGQLALEQPIACSADQQFFQMLRIANEEYTFEVLLP
jgi:hypothetical protein